MESSLFWVIAISVLVAIVGGSVAAILVSLTKLRDAEAARDAAQWVERETADRCAKLEARLRPITRIEAEAAKVQSKLAAAIRDSREDLLYLNEEIAVLRKRQALVTKATAEVERQNLERSREAEDLLAGLHPPMGRLGSTAEYEARISRIHDEIKVARKSGDAWDQSASGPLPTESKVVDQAYRELRLLMLRAFNAECQIALGRLNWRNLNAMQTLIERAWKDINRAGKPFGIAVSDHVRAKRLQELQLTAELEVERHREAEEQRELRSQQREEAREQREMDKERERAEEEERRRAVALEQARRELAVASSAQREAMEARVAAAEAALADAQRAVSQAQLTRHGHVYIISNIGSFGEDIYKIGLTRRLDPQERIDELGDASVPFDFDVHAFIRSDDAPALEASFHRALEMKRLNLVNPRREFFHVSISEVEAVARSLGVQVQLTHAAEARQFRESLVKRGLSPDTIRWKDELARIAVVDGGAIALSCTHALPSGVNAHAFESLEDADEILTSRRSDYNAVRPHSALVMLTPREFAGLGQGNAGRS